jgi:signal transduction histidine kinase
VALLRSRLLSSVNVTARNESANVVSLVEGGELPNPIPIPRGDIAVQVVSSTGKVVASTTNVAGKPNLFHYPKTQGFSSMPVEQEMAVPSLQVGAHDHNFVLVAAKVPVTVSVVAQLNKTYVGVVSGSHSQAGSSKSGPVVFTTTDPGTYYVNVWASVQAVDQSMRSLIVILLLGFPLLLAVVFGSTWIIAGRAFLPVERIRIDVDDISGSNLSRRVFEPGTDDEIGRLAHTMNQMLDRLENAVEERKRFVADASHELKSPLSSLRTSLEIALRHPESTDWSGTALGAIGESQRMQYIIEDLLLLAKSDVGQLVVKREVIDLDDLIVEESRRLRAISPIKVDLNQMSPVRLTGDVERLRSVIRNLLENAVRHADLKVKVTLRRDGEDAVLQVLDDGVGVSVEEREMIFERFTRLDESRSRDLGGSGLGLAIVKSIVVAHGGTVAVVDSEDPEYLGACFIVRLPSESENILEASARSHVEHVI